MIQNIWTWYISYHLTQSQGNSDLNTNTTLTLCIWMICKVFHAVKKRQFLVNYRWDRTGASAFFWQSKLTSLTLEWFLNARCLLSHFDLLAYHLVNDLSDLHCFWGFSVILHWSLQGNLLQRSTKHLGSDNTRLRTAHCAHSCPPTFSSHVFFNNDLCSQFNILSTRTFPELTQDSLQCFFIYWHERTEIIMIFSNAAFLV